MEIERPKYQVTTMRLDESSQMSSSFSNTLHGPAEPARRGLAGAAAQHIDAILTEEAALDDAMERSVGGETMSQREMLELQATVYSYSQRVEVATRVIDRGASALKQLLNTQL